MTVCFLAVATVRVFLHCVMIAVPGDCLMVRSFKTITGGVAAAAALSAGPLLEAAKALNPEAAIALNYWGVAIALNCWGTPSGVSP